MRLVVAIPERWEDANSPVEWALVRPDGRLAREGEGLIADLPPAKRTTLVISAGRVLFAEARLPRRGARRIRGALAYAIEDQLTSDPGSVHTVAAGALRGNQQSVAVIEREWLNDLLAAFQSNGVAPDSATVETCLAPINDGEWTVVLRENGGFVRTGDASGFALDGAFDGSVPDVLQLALEAARGAEGLPRKIMIRIKSALDTRAWERELGVPCEAAGPWREWQSLERPRVEFLQGEFVPASGVAALWPRLRPAAILVAAALAVEILGTFAHWGALRHEKAQLEARMRERFMAAFPQAQAIVDPALQMRRNLEAARAAAGIPQRTEFLPLLAEAARHYPKDVNGHVKAVAYEPGKLTLDVAVADEKQAESLLQAFNASSVFVSLDALNAATKNVRFLLRARAMKTVASDFWQERTTSERGTIQVGALLLGLALAYAYAWLPMARERERLVERVPELRLAAQIMEREGQEFAQIQRQNHSAVGDLKAVIEQVAAATGIPLAQGDIARQDAHRVRVTLRSVRTAQWLDFIARLQSDFGVRLETARLDAAGADRLRSEAMFADAAR